MWCWGNNNLGKLGTSSNESPAPVCWGDNEYGQLGDGTKAGRSSPARVSLPRAATTIALGVLHTCAIDDIGAAWCWGDNSSGALGTGDPTFSGNISGSGRGAPGCPDRDRLRCLSHSIVHGRVPLELPRNGEP